MPSTRLRSTRSTRGNGSRTTRVKPRVQLNDAKAERRFPPLRPSHPFVVRFLRLEDVPRQVLVFHDIGQHLANVVGIHVDLLPFSFRSVEADLIEHSFHDGMQTPRADVFCSFIHTEGEVGDLFQRLWSECQLHTFGFEQRGVLFYKRRLGLGENLDEVVHGERLQFYANGEASLQFGNEVTGLRNVKSPGRDEKNVVGAHHPITRVDGGAFDNGQDVALHTFSRNVRSVAAFAAGNLVDLVEENDAGVLHAINRHARDLVHVDQALLFFLNQVFECLADLHLS